ncbi:ABC-type transport auxiliary lipoprotein family protein [Azospirillum picis]|uniref:Cholesterol transport system auxiliary component n=1 Tax=Azospirillum picis TaxID=488438 RepID=A0ABU0MQ37_9PROT|nr:ABC-type transport auxiliary lipoprotein family protein [Azospirillum picis]MBP2301400.1 cholesterol transport system auxiliary component [Azospirillum picis]MDQ0535231.1 cholesterol transport system auxiliary component [Azospirillum picis]
MTRNGTGRHGGAGFTGAALTRRTALSSLAGLAGGLSVRLGGVVALPGLAACSTLNPTAPQLYTLTPRATVPAGPRADWQLLVEAPSAAAGIDTPRIALSRTPTSLDYFADVSWADRAPNMVQGLIVQTFEDSGRIVSVGRDTVGLRSDYVLKTELRDFQAEYAAPAAAGPDTVHVRLSAKLVAMPRRTIEAGDSFEAVVPVKGRAFTDVIAAFDEALGRVTSELVTWALAQPFAPGHAAAG